MIDEIGERFPATLELSLAAMSFAVVVGVALGVLSAVYQHTIVDYFAMSLALVGVSMPIFWLGLVLLLIFSAVFPGWPTGQRIEFLSTLQPITGLFTVDSLLRRTFPSSSKCCGTCFFPRLRWARFRWRSSLA